MAKELVTKRCGICRRDFVGGIYVVTCDECMSHAKRANDGWQGDDSTDEEDESA